MNSSHPHRAIVESLRTGVPSAEAVTVLGSGQTVLDGRFDALLQDVRRGMTGHPRGFVFAGDFGSGKSHVLESFAAEAVARGFVVSHAAISRNLPLHQSGQVLAELVATTRTVRYPEDGFAQILGDASASGRDTRGLVQWTKGEVDAGRLAAAFLDTAELLRELTYGTEDFNTVADFWSGAKILKSELSEVVRRRRSTKRNVDMPAAPIRPWQSIRFLSRLFSELGHAGWIVLLDELELVRLQGPVSRGKAYAEIARWFGLTADDDGLLGMGVVATITSDFVSTVIGPDRPWEERARALRSGGPTYRVPEAINGDKDCILVPHRLSLTWTNRRLVEPAELGMEFLQSEEVLTCAPHDEHSLAAIQAKVKREYEGAYDCRVPSLGVRQEALRPIRVYIRRWITQWDLARLGRSAEIDERELIGWTDVDVEDDE